MLFPLFSCPPASLLYIEVLHKIFIGGKNVSAVKKMKV